MQCKTVFAGKDVGDAAQEHELLFASKDAVPGKNRVHKLVLRADHTGDIFLCQEDIWDEAIGSNHPSTLARRQAQCCRIFAHCPKSGQYSSVVQVVLRRGVWRLIPSFATQDTTVRVGVMV